MFDLKRYRGVMFGRTDIDATFEGKLTCAFKNYMRNYSKFSPGHV